MIDMHVYQTDYAGIDPEKSRCTYILSDGGKCGARRDRHTKFAGPDLGPAPTHDPVNHPVHYSAMPGIDFECIEMTRWMSFNIGNACKYVWRADRKNGLEDLCKAQWYVKDCIANDGIDVLDKAIFHLEKIVDCNETSTEKKLFFEAVRIRRLGIAELVLDLMIEQAS